MISYLLNSKIQAEKSQILVLWIKIMKFVLKIINYYVTKFPLMRLIVKNKK